jgi:hypothetical protein
MKSGLPALGPRETVKIEPSLLKHGRGEMNCNREDADNLGELEYLRVLHQDINTFRERL